jgi:hypothetical protein
VIGQANVGFVMSLVSLALVGCESSSDGADAAVVGVGDRADAAALAGKLCPRGEFLRGLDATGAIVCEALVLPSITCSAGNFVAGIDSLGNPICKPVELSTEFVRDYVNANCYLYIGWRDSCSGCTDAPVKFARTRGLEPACSVTGGDSSCASFTLFDRTLPMAGLNTDGDVNDDDKFWFGLVCD